MNMQILIQYIWPGADSLSEGGHYKQTLGETQVI